MHFRVALDGRGALSGAVAHLREINVNTRVCVVTCTCTRPSITAVGRTRRSSTPTQTVLFGYDYEKKSRLRRGITNAPQDYARGITSTRVVIYRDDRLPK